MRVGIVGAGIMGASTAWNLAKAGCDVTLIDQGAIPHPQAASSDENRLIRRTYPGQAGYGRQVDDALAAWERLWQAIGQSHYVRCGGLSCSALAGDWTEAGRKAMDDAGLPYRELTTKEIGELCPFLETGRFRWGLLEPDAGVLLAGQILKDLIKLCRDAGVHLLENAAVKRIDPSDGAIHCGNGLDRHFDQLIVTAGAWLPKLLPDFAKRLVIQRQISVYFTPPSAWETAWRRSPAIIDLAHADELYCVPPVGGARLKLGTTATRRNGAAGEAPEVTPGEIETVRKSYRGVVKDIDAYQPAWSRTCWYARTDDARFIVEERDRALVVSACSGHGFKFGAAVGERVSAMVMGKATLAELQSWMAPN